MIAAILIVATLLALNGLFVAAEFSALSTRESRVRKAADEGSVAAGRLLGFLVDPNRLDRYISACQLGITVTSLALGAYCETRIVGVVSPVLEDLGGMQVVAAHSLAIVIVIVGLTAIQVVLGEMVPKAIALHRPDRTALVTLWPLVVFQAVLGVLITFFNGSARFFLWLFRAPAVVHKHVHSRQEIDLMFEQSRQRGSIEAEQHERLQHVLQLEDVTARQLMIPRKEILALDIDAEGQDPVQALIEGQHTRMPVYRGTIDEVLGVLHTKDVAREAVTRGLIKDWRRLVRPVVFVNEGMTADRLLTTMRDKKTMQAVVMDEFGGVAGLVTLEDVLTHVFGEVGDEFSAESGCVEELGDGALRFAGRARLDEVEGRLRIVLDGFATTIGGFVTEQLGHFPAPGESAEYGGWSFTVEAAEKNVVTSVLVRAVPPVDEAGGVGG